MANPFPSPGGDRGVWGTKLVNFFSPFFDLVTGLFKDNVIPGASIKTGEITDTQIATTNKDGVAGTASMRTLGTGAQQSAPGNDSRFVTNGDAHDHNGGDGAQIDHVNLANKGTNTHAQVDTFIASKAAASGLASLNAGGNVVQMPEVAWTTPAYNAGDFTASGSMTWTVESGDIVSYEYVLMGKFMFVSFALSTTTVGGTVSNTLFIKVPGGKTVAKAAASFLRHNDGSVWSVGFCYVGTGSTTINLYKDMATNNWTVVTNGLTVQGQIMFEIQ